MFFVFAVQSVAPGTTCLRSEMLMGLEGPGRHRQLMVGGLLLMESRLDRHLVAQMQERPELRDAFVGPCDVVRRPYTLEELSCVDQVMALPSHLLPPKIKKLHCPEHFAIRAPPTEASAVHLGDSSSNDGDSEDNN